jgi:hypothetical protein
MIGRSRGTGIEAPPCSNLIGFCNEPAHAEPLQFFKVTDQERTSKLSRRDFLKALGLGAGAAALSGCAPELFRPIPIPTALTFPSNTPFQPSPPTGTPTATSPPSATPTATDLPTETPTQWTWSLPTRTGTATDTPDATQASTLAAEAGGLCFILWDHQLARYNYKPRNPKKPLPETCPLRAGATMRMAGAWEEYWKAILHLLNPGMSDSDFEDSWKGLVSDARAFTNNSAPESGNFALHSLTCGGATHQMVTGKPEGKYMRIYTLNHSEGPPPIPTSPGQIDITRHFFATTGSTKQLPDGSYAVYGFPQFENCIVPLLSPKGTDLVEVSRIKVVGSVQRPYNT